MTSRTLRLTATSGALPSVASNHPAPDGARQSPWWHPTPRPGTLPRDGSPSTSQRGRTPQPPTEAPEAHRISRPRHRQFHRPGRDRRCRRHRHPRQGEGQADLQAQQDAPVEEPAVTETAEIDAATKPQSVDKTVTPDPRPPPSSIRRARRPIDPGSFRDPGNRVFTVDGDVYLVLDKRNLDALEARPTPASSASNWYGQRGRHRAGRRRPTPTGAPPGGGPGCSTTGGSRSSPTHTSGLLHAAGRRILQLDLLEAALTEDMILKDSTPYNVQFVGARPVFIDVGSFEPLEQGDIWVATGISSPVPLPADAAGVCGSPHQPWLRGDADGPTAEQMAAMLPLRHRAQPAVAAQRDPARPGRTSLQDSTRTPLRVPRRGFKKEPIQSNVAGCAHRGRPRLNHGRSTWNRYADECSHVSRDRGPRPTSWRVARRHRPKVVWDLGQRRAPLPGGGDGAAGARRRRRPGGARRLLPQPPRRRERRHPPHAPGSIRASPGLGWRGGERAGWRPVRHPTSCSASPSFTTWW